MECGSLSVIGPHNLIDSGTTEKCGLVEVGVALLEEESVWGRALRSPMLCPSTLHFQLPADHDVGLSAPSSAPSSGRHLVTS